MIRGRLTGTGLGAALGTLVGLVVHFLSWTLPSTYYVGSVHLESEDTASVTTWPQEVHPSWWPSLPIAILVGATLGYLTVVMLTRSGWELVRKVAPPASTAEKTRPTAEG